MLQSSGHKMEIVADAEWISDVNDVYEYLRNINEQNMKPETGAKVSCIYHFKRVKLTQSSCISVLCIMSGSKSVKKLKIYKDNSVIKHNLLSAMRNGDLYDLVSALNRCPKDPNLSVKYLIGDTVYY